jgi:vancomycin permeability regulator SanA
VIRGTARRIRRALRTRAGQRRAFQAATLLAVLTLLPMSWLYVTTAGRFGTEAQAPDAPVGVVFGAGLDQGRPSPYLAARLDAALALYRRGAVRALLVTGDNSRTTYDETDAMRDYLVARGVPADRVVGDYAGFTTWDSCARARRVFGVRRAVLVSQEFHIRRAVALCDAAGVESYGVGVDGPHDTTWYYGGVREIGAAAKALLDVVFQPDPHFLGPRVQVPV